MNDHLKWLLDQKYIEKEHFDQLEIKYYESRDHLKNKFELLDCEFILKKFEEKQNGLGRSIYLNTVCRFNPLKEEKALDSYNALSALKRSQEGRTNLEIAKDRERLEKLEKGIFREFSKNLVLIFIEKHDYQGLCNRFDELDLQVHQTMKNINDLTKILNEIKEKSSREAENLPEYSLRELEKEISVHNQEVEKVNIKLKENLKKKMICKATKEKLDRYVKELTEMIDINNSDMERMNNSRAEVVYKGCKISVIQEDITDIPVDAIVNPANSHLGNEGGAARVIADNAGAEFQDECTEFIIENDELKPGEAFAASAGDLHCNYVFNTVGPRCKKGTEEASLEKMKILENCVKGVLKLMVKNDCKSLGLLAISTGIYHFPINQCVDVYKEELIKFIDKKPDKMRERTIYLCNYDSETTEKMKKVVSKIKKHKKSSKDKKRISKSLLTKDPISRSQLTSKPIEEHKKYKNEEEGYFSEGLEQLKSTARIRWEKGDQKWDSSEGEIDNEKPFEGGEEHQSYMDSLD